MIKEISTRTMMKQSLPLIVGIAGFIFTMGGPGALAERGGY